MSTSRQLGFRLDANRLRRLIDAGRVLVAERELETVFDRLLAVARDLTGAQYAAIRDVGDASGLEVATTVELEYEAGTRETRMEPDVEIAIYRIVQETWDRRARVDAVGAYRGGLTLRRAARQSA